jgi:hypothetical protein
LLQCLQESKASITLHYQKQKKKKKRGLFELSLCRKEFCHSISWGFDQVRTCICLCLIQSQLLDSIYTHTYIYINIVFVTHIGQSGHPLSHSKARIEILLACVDNLASFAIIFLEDQVHLLLTKTLLSHMCPHVLTMQNLNFQNMWTHNYCRPVVIAQIHMTWNLKTTF